MRRVKHISVQKPTYTYTNKLQRQVAKTAENSFSVRWEKVRSGCKEYILRQINTACCNLRYNWNGDTDRQSILRLANEALTQRYDGDSCVKVPVCSIFACMLLIVQVRDDAKAEKADYDRKDDGACCANEFFKPLWVSFCLMTPWASFRTTHAGIESDQRNTSVHKRDS